MPASFTTSLSVYRHSKPGLICTIKIFQALLENSNVNLTFLAPHLHAVIAIGLGLFNQSFSSDQPSSSASSVHHQPIPIDPTLGYFGSDWVSQDLDITLATIDLFSSYAESIRSDSLQDDQLARNYLFFLAKFSSVAMLCPPTPSLIKSEALPSPSNPDAARCMALMALESSLKSPGLYSSSHFDRQIRMIIPGLMASIIPSSQRNPDELLKIILQALLDHPHEPSSSSTQNQLLRDMKHLRSLTSPLHKPGSTQPTESDLINYSVKTLNYLLSVQLTNLNQFEICVNGILGQLESTISTDLSGYYNWFGKSLLSWATPKYRSIVIDLVVDRLTILNSKHHPQQSPPSVKPRSGQRPPDRQQDLLKMLILAGMLKTMLDDPIVRSIQLLNTLNILHLILRLLRSILEPSHESLQPHHNLRDVLVGVIGSLAHTVHYDELVDDICKDLLGRVGSIMQSLSPEAGPLTEPIELSPPESSFLIAILESLGLVFANSIIRSPSSSQSNTTSSKREHYSSILPLWKDSLLILGYRKEFCDCKATFARTLISYLKSDVFTAASTFNSSEVDAQHLTQFLSALNIAVYLEVTSQHQSQSASEGGSTLPSAPDLSGRQPQSRNHQGSTDQITNSRPRPISNVLVEANGANGTILRPKDEVTFSDCMLEIQSNQHPMVLLVCLPMLRRLAEASCSESNPAQWELTQSTVSRSKLSPANKAVRSPQPTIDLRQKHDLVLKLLERIGEVWGIHEGIQAAIRSAGSPKPQHRVDVDGDYGRVQSLQRPQILWDEVFRQISHSSVLQAKSGLDRTELESRLNQPLWTIEEARALAGLVTINLNGSNRRASIVSSLASPHRHQQRRLSRAAPTITSSHDPDNQTLSRQRTPPQLSAPKKGRYLSVLLNRSSPNQSLSSSLKSPSVSDLRNSLLGVGFYPNSAMINSGLGAKRPTSISGHDSSVLNTTTTDLNHCATASNSVNNHSIGDWSKFVDARCHDHATVSLPTSIRELGVIRNGSTLMNVNCIGHDQAGKIEDDHPVAKKETGRRRMTMARRKTLTNEILEKSRRNDNSVHLPLGSPLRCSKRDSPNPSGNKEQERRRNSTHSSRSLPHHFFTFADPDPDRDYHHFIQTHRGIRQQNGLRDLNLNNQRGDHDPERENSSDQPSLDHHQLDEPIKLIENNYVRKSLCIRPPYDEDGDDLQPVSAGATITL